MSRTTPDDPHEQLRALLAEQRLAVLATSAQGRPYTSLVAFAVTPESCSATWNGCASTFPYGLTPDPIRLAADLWRRRQLPRPYVFDMATAGPVLPA